MYLHTTQPMHRFLKYTFLVWLSFILNSAEVKSQTDFAPGQIMFTGFDSDPADAFSIVLLTDVVSGTVIYITDRGWSTATGFRTDNNGEGTISYTFTADYPCGTTIVFTDIGGGNDWQARDIYGVVIGTVAIQAGGDGDGMELGFDGAGNNPSGDQLFIYQLPEPTTGNQGSFVTMIQMDNNLSGAVDTDEESQLPSGLPANTIVRFNSESDNAKYDCSPTTGTAAVLQVAISNDNGAGGLISDASNNWAEANTAYLNLFPACNFCCGSTPPAPAPVIDAPSGVSINQVFTITISGTLPMGAFWELYTAGCGIGAPLQTTMSSSFVVTAPATEGTVTYFVRSSEDIDCEAICATVDVGVCINVNNMNTCTNCSADPTVCGDCFLPPTAINPDLDSGCYAIKLIFVLDESGSIGSDEANVRAGVLAFLNSLNGQDLEVALIEFSDLGRVVNDYTPINNTYIFNIGNYFDNIPYPGSGHTYIPGGGTNWHDAMIKVDAMASADMVMFFTDGIPTGWTNGVNVDYCGNGSSTQTPEIVNPVKLANKIKGENTHMFMLGVGTGIDAANLQLMSGPEQYDETINTIGSSDYAIGNFAELAQDLQAFVSELCNTPLILNKQLFGAVCDSTQQFMFIISNPGTESAATFVEVRDTFPSGYENITYNGNEPFIKLCIGAGCEPYGYVNHPPNAFIWTTNSVPPGGSDTLILSADLLPTGNYTNVAWALGSNTSRVSDTITSPNFVDDLPPLITCPANVTIDCSESTLPVNTGNATATDPDGSNPAVTYADVTVAGLCPEEYLINRTWLATDGCFNTVNCIQVIQVESLAPEITTCALIRNIEGCSTAAITGPSYSASTTMSMIGVFEDAVNQGVVASACGTASISYIDVASGTCPIVVTRTWTISDLCGNSATCAQTINVDDSAAPMIATCPAVRNIEGCNPSAITNPPYSASMAVSSEGVFENGTNMGATSDGCAVTVVNYIDAVTGTCPTVVTRTWTITDACGNASTCNQTINVDDTAAPSVVACAVTRNIEGCGTAAISGPAYSTVLATSSESVFENGANQGNISDACAITAVSYIDVATGTCPIVVTRTWTVNDACGNSTTCAQTINVDDTVVPTVTTCAVTRNINGCSPTEITGPAYSTVAVASSEGVFENATNQGSILDACGITAVMYIDVAAGVCPTVVTRTWTITDACGNINTCNQAININNVAPAISGCAVARTIEGCSTAAITGPGYSAVSAASSEVVFENATNQGIASDACGITTVTYIDVATGTCPIVVTRTWTVTDGCGATTTCAQIIQVDDTTAPTVSACPVTRNIEGCGTSAITGPIYSTVTATSSEAVFENATNQGNTTDACGITGVTYIDVLTGTCPRVVTRTWTVTDGCGNVTTCNQTINVDDTIAPAIANCPATRNIEGCGTSAITGPVYSTVLATSNETVFEDGTNQGNVSDACGITSVTYIDVLTGTCPRVVTRTWTVSDACGNTTSCVQTINIDDTVAPAIAVCPTTRNIEGCSAAAITGPAYSTILATSSELVFEDVTNQGSTSDACGITSVSYIDVASGTCPTVVTRTWTLSDACGNSTTCAQTINVDDSIAPAVATCPGVRNIEGCSTADITSPVYSSVSASSTEVEFENATNGGSTSDACGITTVAYIDVASGTCPIVVTRTWTVVDACGNITTCVQTINIDDTTPPVPSCPVNVTISCTASTAPANTGITTASDNCDPSPEVTYSDATVASAVCPQEYTINRTWTTTDLCGNTTTCLQVITIDDSVAPLITCPADLTIQCIDDTSPANTGTATATDDCDASPSMAYSDVTIEVPLTHGYLIERTWTTTDTCGNEATCLQTITVDNPLDPVLIGLPFDTICSGGILAFEADVQGFNPITYDWSFGSGSNPSTQTGLGPHNVQYTYNATNGSVGAWVILTVGTPGCADVSDTVSNIIVHAIPNAAISVAPAGNVCVLANKTFQPVAMEMLGFTYSWNFGAEASIPPSSGYGPYTVEYFTSGAKTVQLIVFSNEPGASCGDTSTVTFTVNNCSGNITGRVLKSDGSPIASVNVRLYVDQNRDGAQDGPTAIRSVNTTSQGVYSIASVLPGYYVLVESQPTGYISLYDEDTTEDMDSVPNTNMNDNIIPVTVEPIEFDSNNLFVEIVAPGMISGYVFEDFNNNQMPVPIEGLPGVLIELYTDSNTNGIADPGGFVESTTTSSSGYFVFGDVDAGSYVIIEHQPADYTSVKDFDTSNDADIVTNFNMVNDTIPVTIANAEHDEGNYFIEGSVCSKVVTTVLDGVPGSLRYMIDCAQDMDTITFHPLLVGQTLVMNAGRLEINKDLFIHSDLTPRLGIEFFVDGGFKIFDGAIVELRNLAITSGFSGFPGAAFDNYGHLTLWDVSVFRNDLLPISNYLLFNGGTGILDIKGLTDIETE